MTRGTTAAAFVLATLIGGAPAFAQEAANGPGAVEITIIPGGGTFFTESKNADGPSFGNYDLGGSITLNLHRIVAVEGEVSGSLGIKQDLQFGGGSADLKTPNLLNYSGNVVVSAPNRTSVVPYVTAGVGALSLFEKASVGVLDSETFLTGNVGGGVKWYAGRWGLRADYRFIAVNGKDEAPEFFGQDTRYGHRVYGGIILNVGAR
jgi:hypothetical protein